MTNSSSGAAPRDVTDVERYTRKSGTSFYYSFLFLPRAKRQGIFAVYAFCRAVDDAVDESPDPGEAARKLEQWEKEIGNAYRGEPETAVGRAVAETVQRFDIPRRHFQEVIAGVRMDLERNRYQTFEDLRPYCDRVAGAVGLICVRIFGVTGERADEYARNLGTGLQLINIMRDVGGDAARGRIYLPKAELERFGVTEDEILENRYTPRFAALMSHQAERARSFLTRADASAFGRKRALLFPAEAMGAIYAALLRNIEKADYNVFDQRIRVGRMKKIAIVLSLRLRALRRRFASGNREGDAEAD
jgi:phytoene synthase